MVSCAYTHELNRTTRSSSTNPSTAVMRARQPTTRWHRLFSQISGPPQLHLSYFAYTGYRLSHASNTNWQLTHTQRETHTHPFNGPLSGTTRVSRYQKGKPIWILLKQETVSGSGISWANSKSAPRSRQITTPAPHRSVFYRPDALPAAQPTASKHWQLLPINHYQ